MSISEKISKGQYDLNRQNAKIATLPSGNISKYEFFTGKNGSPGKNLPEKATTMKIFGYLPLSKDVKALTEISKKQHQKLGDTFEFDEISKKEKLRLKKYKRSNLIHNSKYSLYSYDNIKNFNSLT